MTSVIWSRNAGADNCGIIQLRDHIEPISHCAMIVRHGGGRYLAEMFGQLAEMASSENLTTAAYLFRMAKLELENATGDALREEQRSAES